MTIDICPSPDFADRGILITGGGSGIGASLVEAFVAAGANVAFIDIDEKASHGLVERLSSKDGKKPFFFEADRKSVV